MGVLGSKTRKALNFSDESSEAYHSMGRLRIDCVWWRAMLDLRRDKSRELLDVPNGLKITSADPGRSALGIPLDAAQEHWHTR